MSKINKAFGIGSNMVWNKKKFNKIISEEIEKLHAKKTHKKNPQQNATCVPPLPGGPSVRPVKNLQCWDKRKNMASQRPWVILQVGPPLPWGGAHK